MYFKVFAASALAGMSFTIAAGAMGDTQTSSVFDGVYIGAGASVVNMFNETSIYNASSQGVIPINLGTLQFQAASGFSSVGARINLGYSRTFNNVGYLGAELGYRYAPVYGGSVIGNNGNTTSYVNGRAVNDIAAILRGGYLFAPGVLTYGLIGVSGTYFDYNFTDYVSVKHDFSKMQYGLTPGIGMEVSLSSAVTLDLRYTYNAYSQTSHKVQANHLLDAGGGNYDLFQTTPRVQAASLTVNYHFS